MTLGLLATLAFASSPCSLDDGSTEPTVPIFGPSEAVYPLLGIHLNPDTAEQSRQLLTMLADKEQQATVFIRPEHVDELRGMLKQIQSGGHEVAVDLSKETLDTSLETGPLAIRALVKPLTKVMSGRPKAAYYNAADKRSQAVLNRSGFRDIWLDEAEGESVPKVGRRYEGAIINTYMYPPGPYQGCDASPVVQGLTFPHLDRFARALNGASQVALTSTVRLELIPSEGDVQVLETWLDSTFLSAEMRFRTSGPMRAGITEELRVLGNAKRNATPQAAGRLVSIRDLRQAADALKELERLPRELPGDLNLTEAYEGLMLLLAEKVEGDVVRLGDRQGPHIAAQSNLSTSQIVPRSHVIALAQALRDDLPQSIPASLPIGPQLFTASEVLMAFAAAVRGDDPIVIAPTEPPDLSVQGLGWGESTTP